MTVAAVPLRMDLPNLTQRNVAPFLTSLPGPGGGCGQVDVGR